MKKQEYYKIVRRIGGKLYSRQYYDLPKNLITQYYLHRPTVAKLGGLLVFDNLQDAKEYCSTDSELYRCTCREEVILPLRRDSFSYLVSSKYVSCWDRKKWTEVSLRSSDTWPINTKAFKVVTLRERVL